MQGFSRERTAVPQMLREKPDTNSGVCLQMPFEMETNKRKRIMKSGGSKATQ